MRMRKSEGREHADGENEGNDLLGVFHGKISFKYYSFNWLLCREISFSR